MAPQELRRYLEMASPGMAPYETGSGPYTYESTKALYRMFLEKFNPNNSIVLYPGSNEDVSPSQVFPGRVIYVDIDTVAITSLVAAGYEAHLRDIITFVPDSPVDILILRRPTGIHVTPELFSLVQKGGYVLSHGLDQNLLHDERFKLEGVSYVDLVFKTIVLETNTTEYFEPVDTDEQYKWVSSRDFRDEEDTWQRFIGDKEQDDRVSLLLHSILVYPCAAAIVKEVTGKEENVLEEIKGIYRSAEKARSARYKQRGSVSLDEIWGGKAIDIQDELSPHEELLDRFGADLNFDGKPNLPNKKNVRGEAIWIFRRVAM